MKRVFTFALAVLTVLGCMAFPVTAESTGALVNLYDFYQSTGCDIAENGSTAVNDAISGSGALPVTGGKDVFFGPCTKGTVYLATYDESGNFIAKVKAADCKVHATLKDGSVVYSYTLPENAGYVWTAAENKFALDYVLTCDQPFDEDKLNEHLSASNLTGKSALFVGDSICHGTNDSAGDHYGWAGRIGDANDMDWVNNGQSAYSVSTCRQYSAGMIVDKLLEKKDRDFDYVILHGGVNDAWDRVAIGTVSSGFTPSQFNKSTFAGGLEDLFYNAYLYYGDTAAIGYLINFSMPTAGTPSLREMKPYFDIAKTICDKWGVRYFDMFENTKVYSDMKIGTSTYIPDLVHPNAAGYDILAPMIEGFMNTLEQKDMPDGKVEEDGTVYNISFADNDGTPTFSTTATASKGLLKNPATPNLTDDGIVKRKFSGWSFAGRLYGSLDYYEFDSDATFRSVYSEYYGARLEDHAPIKLPSGEGDELTAAPLSLLPESVALGAEATGLSIVYKVEGADSEIIADDLMISLMGEYTKPAWQWGDHLYREPKAASPNNLTLNNGYYYAYMNKNILGNGSVLTRFNIFNKHETHFYNDLTVREPVNNNKNATFQLLAVTPDNLQPVATFHDAEGNVIATYQHKYTDIHKHLSYQPGGVPGSYKSGELLTIDEVFAKTEKTVPEKAPTHGGKVTYEFEGWVDENGDSVPGLYYNCELYPSYRVASDERIEFTVTFMNGDAEHGKVKVKDGDPADIKSPEHSGEAKPFTKYTFAGWVDAEGNAAELSRVTADLTVYASYLEECEHSFPDIKEGQWYEEAVEWALMNGIMNGEGAKFNPDKATTRAMIVTVLYRLEGSPDVSEVQTPFTDVKAKEWYASAIVWAYSTGVVNGNSPTTFNPTGELTREQFATILYRYAKEVKGRDVSVDASANLDKYADKDKVSGYALDAVIWTNANGYIGGVSATKLSPKTGATRAQMATILYRFVTAE